MRQDIGPCPVEEILVGEVKNDIHGELLTTI